MPVVTPCKQIELIGMLTGPGKMYTEVNQPSRPSFAPRFGRVDRYFLQLIAFNTPYATCRSIIVAVCQLAPPKPVNYFLCV